METPTGAGVPAGSAGLGGVPMLGGLGQASAVGRMAMPPSWVAEGAPAASPGAVTTAGCHGVCAAKHAGDKRAGRI